MYNISHSEVLSFGCERKWLYSHHSGYNLESTRTGMALLRGNVGHEALQEYYTLRKEGIDHETAATKAKTVVMMHLFAQQKIGNFETSTMLSDLVVLIHNYFEYYESDIENWEILGVELYFEVGSHDENGRANLVGKIDLVVRVLRGKYAGEIMPIDHKFVYDFWNDNALDMDTQLPKYIYALREMFPEERHRIKRAMVNQIRHRTLKREMQPEEQFLRLPRKPTQTELTGIMENHWAISERIVPLIEMPIEEAKSKVVRNLSKYTCENCSFKRLCKAELLQEDTELMRKIEYQPNSYGYRDK